MQYYARRLAPYFGIFLLVQVAIRLVLAFHDIQEIDSPVLSIAGAMLVGFAYDFITFTYLMIPMILIFTFLPARLHGERADRIISTVVCFIFAYLILFSAVAEWLFWDEFGARFNFIAVDYLVYTQEVIANIRESYPLNWLLGGIGVIAAALTFAAQRFLMPATAEKPTLKRRSQSFATLILLPIAAFVLLPDIRPEYSDNRYVNELGKNGINSLFSAYLHNEINFQTFYSSLLPEVAATRTRELLAQNNSQFVHSKNSADVTHYITASGPEKRYNVIYVIMESMSAEFMQHFGNTMGITPNMDALADQSLFFTQLYATGTRTVRGLEALTLSLPPTPGNSIVRRPGNEDLFSLGFIFRDRGYDTSFIYGGYGYFDNMNYFYEHNGFDIVDRARFTDEDITFTNAWGVSDEDLYNKVIKEADASFAAQKPFLQMVMTTSNHRPYTYPEGKIDIASGSGRMGAVKYADYAVGQLVAKAKTKPWFDNTIFIFVADHTHGSSGKTQLTVPKYLIPAIVYSPANIKPQQVTQLVSQIDLSPTLLGLMNFSYYSKFYGKDALKNSIGRAFISTYEILGYLTADGKLSLLEPQHAKHAEAHAKSSGQEASELNDAISIYQNASSWRTNSKRIDSLKR